MNTSIVSEEALKSFLKVSNIPQHETMSGRIRWVTRWMLKNYCDISNTESINYGYCFLHAYLVAVLTPNDLRFVSTRGHVIIEDVRSEKFYDSTLSGGSKRLHNFMTMGYQPHYNLNLESMLVYWASNGGRGRNVFIEAIQKLHKKPILNGVEPGIIDFSDAIEISKANSV